MNPSYNLQDQELKNINLNINAKEYNNPHSNPKIRINQTGLPNQSAQPSNNQKGKIIEVYEDNFIKELKKMGKCLVNYPYIGMDTEFPGVVYPCPSFCDDFYYKFTKANVDKLKLIQIGISLFNKKGERPPYCSTWQFNLKFDSKNDKIAPESLNLLTSCGIDFDKLRTKGINYDLFAEYFIVSGLLLNEKVTWISFNGFSDFAYMLNIATNRDIPETEEEFEADRELYFPNLYDIKVLINNNEVFKGGLNKIASELGVERIGEMHQAGSDALVTGEVFFALLRMNYISKDDLNSSKNILFGVGLGQDNAETITYTQFYNEPDNRTLMMMVHGGNKGKGSFNSNYSGNGYMVPMTGGFNGMIDQGGYN